jgi:uncharacterized membrane protein YdjX (TVP38/TMEM64 family)
MKRLRLVVFLLILAALVAAAWQLPLERIMVELQSWVSDNPRWAFLGMVAVLVVGIVIMLPTSILIMLSGFLFGLAEGFLIVWIATFFGSTAAFLIGRSLARPMVERRIARKLSFQAIDRAIRRKGFFVVLLTRLILVLPFPALNYSHGLTNVRLRDYVAGTMLGMAPPILLFVYLGTLASDVADIVNGRVALDGAQLTLVIAGATVLLAVAVLIALVAKKALQQELKRANEGG